MNPVHTLLIQEGGARLLDGSGGAPVPCEAAALREALPAGARVQLILAGSAVHCAEVPFLPPRERRDVAARLAREAGLPGDAVPFLERDDHADGGHLLWLAAFPHRELEAWLEALAGAGATVLCALPWQRAVAAEGLDGGPSALFLLADRDEARLVYFRGRGPRFARTFRLPSATAFPGEALPALSRLAAEELTLLLHYLRQKHRDAPPARLTVVGLPEEALPTLEALDLELSVVPGGLDGFLARGADRARLERGGLDLLPPGLREARRIAALRTVVRVAVAGALVLGAGTQVFLARHERTLAREVVAAEAAARRREALARDGDAAARQRFGLLRLRRAEERQRREAAELERLGLRILRASEGVDLGRVEIGQDPANDLVHRFTVEGTARTGRLFSLGFLAAYVRHVEEEPGLKLEPLKDITVGDDPGAAQAKFRLTGTAP
ncbi:hypothetical protein METEAL_13790 [Mesoterricola silvestris]|uniref:Uncharacterized protein n=1 Tax=Mesoterricola silvestris TaxID=2927979 RepID=A0AA48GMG0_9BACT|nr:hypothetical protein METEAL_13790 [Mesoterricola silvestris]